MRVDVITLGCSKNLVDSEKLLKQFEAEGYTVRHDPNQIDADIVVINTCGFIGDAQEESIEMILNCCELKKQGVIKGLYVMGCLSQKFGKDLQVEIPEEFISIPMDPILIEQVLINILENAVDHAKGMTELTLQVSLQGQEALFRISDNGCGIAEERMKNLFTGYLDREYDEQSADSSRNNMGIGLSVCATIIKAHGSEIFAENRKEGGAAFWFTLEREENGEE